MKRNLFLQVIIGCLAIFLAKVCRAEFLSTQEALFFAESKGKELITMFQEPDVEKRFEELDKLFLTYIDVDYISSFVAGRYWRKMTPEQKQKYKDLFVRYGLAFYKMLPFDAVQNVEYEIKGAEIDGNFTTVAANVKIGTGKNVDEKQDITLIFRLHKVNGAVKAVDVKVAESSLLLSYRSKFSEMIAQSDGEIDWFLEDFEDLVKSLERNLPQKAALN